MADSLIYARHGATARCCGRRTHFDGLPGVNFAVRSRERRDRLVAGPQWPASRPELMPTAHNDNSNAGAPMLDQRHLRQYRVAGFTAPPPVMDRLGQRALMACRLRSVRAAILHRSTSTSERMLSLHGGGPNLGEALLTPASSTRSTRGASSTRWAAGRTTRGNGSTATICSTTHSSPGTLFPALPARLRYALQLECHLRPREGVINGFILETPGVTRLAHCRRTREVHARLEPAAHCGARGASPLGMRRPRPAADVPSVACSRLAPANRSAGPAGRRTTCLRKCLLVPGATPPTRPCSNACAARRRAWRKHGDRPARSRSGRADRAAPVDARPGRRARRLPAFRQVPGHPVRPAQELRPLDLPHSATCSASRPPGQGGGPPGRRPDRRGGGRRARHGGCRPVRNADPAGDLQTRRSAADRRGAPAPPGRRAVVAAGVLGSGVNPPLTVAVVRATSPESRRGRSA